MIFVYLLIALLVALTVAAGFRYAVDRRHPARLAAERWALPSLVADPADRRAAQVTDAYLAGEFGPEELDWRILLALDPPPPDRDARARQWELALEAMRERMMEPIDVSGFKSGRVLIFPTQSTTWTAAPPTSDALPWTAAPRSGVWPETMEGEHCRFVELAAAGGPFATFCECGHPMNRHYNGGCNDCDAARSQFPRPEMQEIDAPPRPANPVKPTRRESRQSHG